MNPDVQDLASSPQVTGLPLAELYQRLRVLDAEKQRLRDEYERFEASLDRPCGLEDRQSAIAHIRALKSVFSGADTQIDQIRQSVNQLSRPFLRPLHVFDLPDEVLVAIFRALHSGDPLDRVRTQYIQDARLTCRRFCSTSSQFLVNTIHVEASYASLERLNKIASHPAIGRGEMAIKVHLAVFDDVLAHDLVRFVEYHNETLQDRLLEFKRHSREEASKHAEKARRVMRAWNAFAHQPVNYSPTEEDSMYQRLLQRKFEEYQSQCSEQQELLEHGVFVAKVASAMAVTPTPTRLTIDDSVDNLRASFRKPELLDYDAKLSDGDRFCERLFAGQRMSYEDQRNHELGRDAIAVVPNLLAALDTVDAHIDSLAVEFSRIEDFAVFKSVADTDLKIGPALRDLKVFDFSNRGSVMFRSHHELEVLRHFLAPIINVGNLERLSVRLNLWDNGGALDPTNIPPVSVINARTAWPNLSSAILDTLHIDYSDLEHLLSCVKSPQGYVGLHKTHLMGGSWRPILDALRERHAWARLTSPSGAECETMSPEEYERVFGLYYGLGIHTKEEEERIRTTKAEAYIRGWIDRNPLISQAELGSELIVTQDASIWL